MKQKEYISCCLIFYVETMFVVYKTDTYLFEPFYFGQNQSDPYSEILMSKQNWTEPWFRI